MFISAIPYIMFAVGLLMLIKGGDWFVDSAVWIARRTGLPEVIIGATIVSIATTLPELFVSSIASIEGHPDMAVGNAVGSLICNIGLILGLTTLFSPSRIINPRIFRLNGLIMITYTLVLYLLSADGMIRKPDSAILLLLFAFYILTNLAIMKYKQSDAQIHRRERAQLRLAEAISNIFKFTVGITLIILGAHMLVEYGYSMAILLGVPVRILSLTLIALSTSLPELITSVSALLKGHKSISIGNIIGANILNACMVMGASSQFANIPIKPTTLYLDLPVSLAMMVILIVPSAIKKRTSRLQSAVLVAIYVAYTLLLGHLYL